MGQLKNQFLREEFIRSLLSDKDQNQLDEQFENEHDWLWSKEAEEEITQLGN